LAEVALDDDGVLAELDGLAGLEGALVLVLHLLLLVVRLLRLLLGHLRATLAHVSAPPFTCLATAVGETKVR
jgi:hypothetical protein